MKFKNYLNEKIDQSIKQYHKDINKKMTKKYNISKNDIDIARKALAKKYNVKEKDMVFAFVSEMMPDKIVFLTFNIEDKNHKNYKSSINYRWLPEEKRGV